MERRPQRVAHRVQEELARLLLREVRDPRLHAVQVSAVRMSPDLRLARIFVRTLAAQPDPAPMLAGLARATPFLRGRLGRALGLRHVPELRFEYDSVVDSAARLESLLRGAGEPEGEA